MRVARILATVAAAAAVGLVFGTPAHASDITLNPDHKGKFAGDFEQKCQDERFAGRKANEDAWHFVLPGGGAFTSISVTFETDGIPDENPADDFTYAGTPEAPGQFVFYSAGGDDKHAYLFTPAGYQTINGSGTATKGDKFNVSHACKGTKGSQTSETPSPDPSPSVSPSGEGGNLPKTGTASGVIVMGGAALIAGGVALLAFRRRRDMIGG